MLRNQVDELPQNTADFPQLPSRQTVSFILSFLDRWLPSFCSAYLSSAAFSPQQHEDEISEELLFFLEAKAKPTDLLIHFDAQKGVDFLIRILPPKLGAKPIFVIEAKRLSKKHRDYVQGRTGGIERFKREHKGFDHHLAVGAMVGYVQEKNFVHWYNVVNGWIKTLIEQSNLGDDVRWKQQDLLKEFPSNVAQTARFISTHSRKTQIDIELHHFWLNMYC